MICSTRRPCSGAGTSRSPSSTWRTIGHSPRDDAAFDSLRQAPQRSDRGGLTDAEIDQYLPRSLRLPGDAPEPAHAAKS